MNHEVQASLLASEQMRDYDTTERLIVNTVSTDMKKYPDFSVILTNYQHNDQFFPALHITSDAPLHQFVEPIRKSLKSIGVSVVHVDVQNNILIVGFHTPWYTFLQKLQAKIESQIHHYDPCFGAVVLDPNENVIAIRYTDDVEDKDDFFFEDALDFLSDKGHPIYSMLKRGQNELAAMYLFQEIGDPFFIDDTSNSDTEEEKTAFVEESKTESDA